MQPSNRLFGHERTVASLRKAILGERSMPTWIFGGPGGIGKFTAARLLAGLLLDPETRDEDIASFTPRLDTPSGALFAAGTHPDLHVVCKELALESPVAEVRERKQRSIPVAVLRQHVIGGSVDGHSFDAPAYIKPYRGDWKVFIIDEAELLEPRAQNLLLKTLEEPPLRTCFILVSRREDMLLPTIRSRCQRALFSPIDADAMAEWLAGVTLDASEEEIAWAIQFAEGAPGLVVAAIEEGMFAWWEALSPMLEELATGGFPGSMSEVMSEFIDESAATMEKADRHASREAAGRRAMGLMVGMLSSMMRQRMHAALDQGAFEQERWASAIETLARTETQVTANVNRKLALAGLAAALAQDLAPQGVSG